MPATAAEGRAGPEVGGAARDLMRWVFTLLQQSAAGAARVAADADSRAGWQELRNKVEAFRTFEHVDSLLGLPMSSPLRKLADRAAALQPPLCVWAAEGVAYHATAARCARGGIPRELLKDRDLPRHLLVPLHAGMGSALAAAMLDERPRFAVAQSIASFEAACEANSDPEHVGVALEALGFAAQSMFGGLVPAVASAINATQPGLAPFFWHGAGRAMYFSPTASFVALGGRTSGVSNEQLIPPMGDRVNAMAGFSWAATLVNLRHPHVLEPLVREASATPAASLACGVGVQSALEVWRRCAPADPALSRFCAHVPDSSAARRAWRLVVDEASRPVARPAGELFAVVAADADAAGARG